MERESRRFTFTRTNVTSRERIKQWNENETLSWVNWIVVRKQLPSVAVFVIVERLIKKESQESTKRISKLFLLDLIVKVVLYERSSENQS